MQSARLGSQLPARDPPGRHTRRTAHLPGPRGDPSRPAEPPPHPHRGRGVSLVRVQPVGDRAGRTTADRRRPAHHRRPGSHRRLPGPGARRERCRGRLVRAFRGRRAARPPARSAGHGAGPPRARLVGPRTALRAGRRARDRRVVVVAAPRPGTLRRYGRRRVSRRPGRRVGRIPGRRVSRIPGRRVSRIPGQRVGRRPAAQGGRSRPGRARAGRTAGRGIRAGRASGRRAGSSGRLPLGALGGRPTRPGTARHPDRAHPAGSLRQ